MPTDEPEIRRAKARRYVQTCNSVVHEAPWTTGKTDTIDRGGIYRALELAERAYEAHELPYEGGVTKMWKYPPGRFRWIYDETGSADDCVKVFDIKTRRLVVWPFFKRR